MKAGNEWHIMIAERFGALPEKTSGCGYPRAISTEDTNMLRRILVGAAIASAIVATSGAAHADYVPKPEKEKESGVCTQSNVAAGGLIGGVLSNILNLNGVSVNVLAQDIENCVDDD
ncbi:hypothetical protein [Nonomuraea dietziae]|uniref:hypothetical protein n=1 Tax=Nonomuraea dietziae TaxID=65515 RepID=UPI0033FD7AD9